MGGGETAQITAIELTTRTPQWHRNHNEDGCSARWRYIGGTPHQRDEAGRRAPRNEHTLHPRPFLVVFPAA